MGIEVPQSELRLAFMQKRVAVLVTMVAVISGCEVFAPTSYLLLKPLEDLKGIQDPDRTDTARPRSGPRYVYVSLGEKERWKLGDSIEDAKIREFISPELERRGWCPDSYDILRNTFIGPGNFGLGFTIKCK